MKSFKTLFSTFVYSASIFLIISGCKEEKDELAPRIFPESPFENQQFFSTDTITAEARITDDNQIEYVDLEILDANFNQVSVKERYLASGTTFEFGQLFPINGPELQTGIYYLAFRAGDGENVGSAFVEIRINAIPRELEGVMVGCGQNNQTYIYRSDDLSPEFTLEFTSFTDLRGGGLNYRQNILGIAGGEVGNVDFLEIEEYGVVNSLPGFGTPGLPYFLSLSFDDERERFYLTEREERIRVFDKRGFALVGFDGLPSHLPLSVFGSDEGYFVLEKEIDAPIYSLCFYSEAGLRFEVYPVAGEVRSVEVRNTNEFFVWVDNPDGLELRLLNLTTGLLSLPYSRPGDRLQGAVRTGSNTFVVSTSSGLLRYNYSNGGTVILNSNLELGELYYDELNELIYHINGNDLTILTSAGNQVGEETFPHPIAFVGFDYNR